MYSLIVRHKDQNIIHRTLTPDELSALDGFGVQWVVNAFKEYIGLDILSYRLNEYDNTDEAFILYIRTEDLEELRNSKLNNLGI
jgi:hypothetical protein